MTTPAAIISIVIEESQEQFSAKIGKGFFGPLTEAPITGVRDVLICANDPSYDLPEGEYLRHPPIGSLCLLREEGSSPPVDLGRGVRIDRLSPEEEELVMNACTPRGHYFSPIRQFGQTYSMIRDVNLAEHEEHPFRWDHEGVIWDALSLSRLVRDNGHSTQYAARIIDHEDGMQTVVYTLDWEGYDVRVDPDGKVWARATAHGHYQGCKTLACRNRRIRGTGWTRVSRGSHAGHIPVEVSYPPPRGSHPRAVRPPRRRRERPLFPGRDLRERTTTGEGLRLVPLETIDRGSYQPIDEDVKPPWEKKPYHDPEGASS